MLLTDALEEFRRQLELREKSPVTIYNYTQDLRRFNEWYVARYNLPCDIGEVTETTVEDYLSYMKNYLGVAPVSRNRVLNSLKSFYKTMNRKRFVQVNPVLDIDPAREQKKERTYLTEEEVCRLVDVITKPTLRLFVVTLFYSGMRVSEAVGLTMADVDLHARVIHVIAGKGNKNRDIPIEAATLYPQLLEYRNKHRAGTEPWQRFFVTSSGSLCADYVRHTLTKATRLAGIQKNVTPHVLRHSFASALVRRGIPIVHLQKLLGHASLATTSVYTHVSQDDLVSAVNALKL